MPETFTGILSILVKKYLTIGKDLKCIQNFMQLWKWCDYEEKARVERDKDDTQLYFCNNHSYVKNVAVIWAGTLIELSWILF